MPKKGKKQKAGLLRRIKTWEAGQGTRLTNVDSKNRMDTYSRHYHHKPGSNKK